MDRELYDAVENDSTIDVLKQIDKLDHQLTLANNTALHLACQYGSINCVKEILSAHKSLLLKINSRGETALHLAARYGHYDVVVLLIAAAKSSQLPQLDHNLENILQTLIRTQDAELETALHVAVRYNNYTVVQLLVKEDPSHEHPSNKYNETPVYLATTRGYTNIITTILHYCTSPTFGGPDGRTALHAAVLDKGGESLKLLLDKKKDLIKVADNYGWTVYHYVAYNGLPNIVKDLVCADKSVGNLSDKEHKRTALHVAAYEGQGDVMVELMDHYPDSWEIVDGNGKNILHLALEKDQQEVIRSILSLNFVICNNLLIQRDKEGYTPLHLIAKSGHRYNKLMHLRAKLDWQVLDHKNFTPLDRLRMTDTEQAEQAIVRRVYDRNDVIKKHWGWWRLRKKFDLDDQFYKNLGREGTVKEYKTRINAHMIVAALITTVALTAGFSMPGGFDEKQGSAVLRNKAFKAFVVSDALALLFSMSSLFLYFLSTLSDDELKLSVVVIVCVLLNSISVVAMMMAFMAGTYAVLPHLPNIAFTVCVISSLFILLAVCAFAKSFKYFVNELRYHAF